MIKHSMCGISQLLANCRPTNTWHAFNRLLMAHLLNLFKKVRIMDGHGVNFFKSCFYLLCKPCLQYMYV